MKMISALKIYRKRIVLAGSDGLVVENNTAPSDMSCKQN
jgi:hypothetical protein